MRERSVMRSCGQYFRSPINVSFPTPYIEHYLTCASSCAGSRYIYDMYYEREAISKQLYDWLLKNGYADANLIAKWKKQGYEKVKPP